MAEMNKKQDPYICFPQEIHFRTKDTLTEYEGMKKRYSLKIEIKEICGNNIHIR